MSTTPQERINNVNAVGKVADGEMPKANMGTNNKSDKSEIKINPIAFDSTIDAKILTTLDIAAYINAAFKGVFKHYDGCKLDFDPNSGRWKATVFFTETVNNSNPNAYPNIESLSSKAKNADGKPDMESRLNAVANICSKIHYSLTPITAEALSKYYMPYEKLPKTGEPRWKDFIYEAPEEANYGYASQVIYLAVTGLDVLNVLKDIFGWKNEEGNPVDYWLQMIRPIAQYYQSTPNYLFTLQRVDCKAVEVMSSKVGAVPMTGRLPIIRN